MKAAQRRLECKERPSWNDRGVVEDWRREWAEHANRALARAQVMARIDHRSLASQRQDALHRGDRAAAAALDRPAGVHLGRALHQEVRTGRPAERISRALEGNPASEQPRRQEREGPELRPSGLERISRFDRELRQAIERAAAALRECVRELRHEVERVARWMREMQERQREAEATRQREREWSRKLERDRDGPSFDRDR